MKSYNKPKITHLGYCSASNEQSIVPFAAIIAGVTMAKMAAAVATGVAIAMAQGCKDIVISQRCLPPIYPYKIA